MEYSAAKCVVLSFVFLNVYGKECLRNDDIGWREGNIYECNDVSYPECCEQDGEFTCCEAAHYKTIREQLQLWGTVALMTLVLLVVYAYYRRDFSSDDKQSGICCRKQQRSEDTQPLEADDIGQSRDVSESPDEKLVDTFRHPAYYYAEQSGPFSKPSTSQHYD